MAKENLESNVVNALTLFVGVGGTGSQIVKKVAQMCRKGETDNVNFVCLDTNVNDLKDMTDCDVNLNPIQTSNTQTVGNYLNYDKSASKYWFPKNAVLYGKTVSEGAGQVRAISRLALNATIKVGNLDLLYDTIDDLYRKTGSPMSQAMRCVIVTTASGGTGSGSFLPLSMLIRNYMLDKYPNSSITIKALVLLPETLDSVIRSNVERDSQRRNAYATIKELNAFMMNGSGIFATVDELKRYQDLCIEVDTATGEVQKLSTLPCDFCFLLDGQNSEDSTLVSKEQYMIQAAQALYEQNIGPMKQAAVSIEDNIIKEVNEENLCRNRFGGIGASIIRYPYEKVADYIAYDWANDSIEGEGDVAKWGKYDRIFQFDYAEARKKGVPESERPKIEEKYVSALDEAEDDAFSIELRTRFLSEADLKLDSFFDAFREKMKTVLYTKQNISEIKTKLDSDKLGENKNYEGDTDNSDKKSDAGKAETYLNHLSEYEDVVRLYAKKAAEELAEGIFNNEGRTINEKREYTIEYLLKNSDGPIHPNAMRYFLYKLKTEFETRKNEAESTINRSNETLKLFAEDAKQAKQFDAKKWTRKKEEANIYALCRLDTIRKKGEDLTVEQTIRDVFGGFKEVSKLINRHIQNYYKNVNDLGEAIIDAEAYRVGKKYVDEYCKAFELFYKTFEDKVKGIKRRQGDIVDELAFRKGDSVRNVCASSDVLVELCKRVKTQRAEGSMLEPELNGEIFDAIKNNVKFEREMRTLDFDQEDRRVDIFDKILMDYFRSKVRRDCEEIDMNIIDAIAKEAVIQANVDLEKKGKKEGNEYIYLDNDAKVRYIKSMIDMGERLAAPGIQMMPFEEPRTVNVCAYNQTLDDMRNFRVRDMIPNGQATDTVSQYELRFFNAIYNITPDKLRKFAAPIETETGFRVGGLYHRAYVNYSKNIGPDSSKDLMISTHIDKRWDSIAEMPEIDMCYQRERILKIHKAMLYALIYRNIKRHELGCMSNGKKRNAKKLVYRFTDTSNAELEMIVSNGTLCDEFYEILDAFYTSSALIEEVEKVKGKMRQNDIVKNSDYDKTKFKTEFLDKLALDYGKKEETSGNVTEKKTSLFEVPLVYYNTLPNSQRHNSEIGALIDAVIEVFREELSIWEKKEDARFQLCDILEEQYDLLLNNYMSSELLNKGIQPANNDVLRLVFRKIKEVMEGTPEPDDFEAIVAKMESRLQEELKEEAEINTGTYVEEQGLEQGEHEASPQE